MTTDIAAAIKSAEEALAKLDDAVAGGFISPILASQITDALSFALRDILDVARETQGAQRALESLTPGGSEFVGDSVACRRYIRGKLDAQHGEWVHRPDGYWALRITQPEPLEEAVREAAQELRAWMNRLYTARDTAADAARIRYGELDAHFRALLADHFTVTLEMLSAADRLLRVLAARGAGAG